MVKTKITSLSVEELASLKKELQTYYITSSVFSIAFFYLSHLFLSMDASDWFWLINEILLFIMIVAIVFAIYMLVTHKLRNEILNGTKIVKPLLITRKYSFEDRDDRYSSVYIKYIINVGTRRFVVSEEEYNDAEVSDYIVLHLTSIRELEIKYEIVKAPAGNIE